MRKPFVAGNWKMNTSRGEAIKLAEAIKKQVGELDDVEVGLCPPFVYLDAVAEAIRGSNIRLGAQNLYTEPAGAFTGEVSGPMLKDIGCQYVIVGHSERRHVLGEPDELVANKVRAAFAAGLLPILCVGETRQEREDKHTEEVVRRHIFSGFSGLDREQAAQVVIAYEPVWAIGTGLTATPGEAQQVHRFIRELLTEMFDADLAESVRIQYGGSVKPKNAYELMAQKDIDGALVGGASLKVDSFVQIVGEGARAAEGSC